MSLNSIIHRNIIGLANYIAVNRILPDPFVGEEYQFRIQGHKADQIQMRLVVGDDHGRLAEIILTALREPDPRDSFQQESRHPLEELMVFQPALLRTAFEQEMEECVDMVDDTQYTLSPSHVKKNTVMGILARVYLWRAGYPINGGTADYAKAAEWAGKVVATNQHRLNPDLYAIWKCMATDKYDTEYNESMWEVEFIGNREGDGQGIYTDGRIGNVIGNLQKCTANPGKGYSYAFYAPTLILWDLYSAADKRRDVYIAPYQINNKDVEVAWKDNQIVQRSCGKFRREWETSSMKHKNYTPENYPVLRYSDVLLMQAEAENEANNGPTDKAYKAINTVRERAGLEALKNLDYATFQQEVRDERARELCFESLRKYDLVRWGIYVDAIHNKLGAATATKRWAPGNNFLGAAAYANNTTDKHQFLPIPSRELSVNTKLEQNKFWK